MGAITDNAKTVFLHFLFSFKRLSYVQVEGYLYLYVLCTIHHLLEFLCLLLYPPAYLLLLTY